MQSTKLQKASKGRRRVSGQARRCGLTLWQALDAIATGDESSRSLPFIAEDAADLSSIRTGGPHRCQIVLVPLLVPITDRVVVDATSIHSWGCHAIPDGGTTRLNNLGDLADKLRMFASVHSVGQHL